jgi:hypothetical protein
MGKPIGAMGKLKPQRLGNELYNHPKWANDSEIKKR